MFVGFKKDAGAKLPIKPEPFLFFAPDITPVEGHYLLALHKAEQFVQVQKRDSILLSVEPVEFNSHWIGHCDYVDVYGHEYNHGPQEFKKTSRLLQQAARHSHLISAAKDVVVADAIKAGAQEIEQEEASQSVALPSSKKVVPKKVVKKVVPKKKKKP